MTETWFGYEAVPGLGTRCVTQVVLELLGNCPISALQVCATMPGYCFTDQKLGVSFSLPLSCWPRGDSLSAASTALLNVHV